MIGTADELVLFLMEQSREKPGVKWNVEEYVESRSLNSNSYFYVLVNKIAKKLKISDVEVHDRFLSENIAYFITKDGGFDWKISPLTPNNYGLIKEQIDGKFEYYLFSGREVVLQGTDGDKIKYKKSGEDVCGKLYWHIKGSRQMNKKEMSRLISSVVFEAEQLGIETMTENEIRHMNELWGKKHDEKPEKHSN